MSDEESDDSSGGPSSSSALEVGFNEMTVDAAITFLLSALHLEERRNEKPTHEEETNVKRTHERIQMVITRESDPVRARRLRRANPCANVVREQVLYLRRLEPLSTAASASYFSRLSQALDVIVKDSFDEEYRKVATLLGIVDAVAELLVLEVRAFGMPQGNDHRTIRKFVANALTNLTYGNLLSKRRLCTYNGLIDTVVHVIYDAPNLAQVYAGLIRNLSWMADSDMAVVLSPACAALAKAAVNAQHCGDESCVRATLSALWNLASHSIENKRAICEQDGCLEMLSAVLTPDARMTVVVESASGILKYASQYLSTPPEYAHIRILLTTSLVHLLNSASFTVVTNALNAIANMISKDFQLQNLLRSNAAAMSNLNILRNSTREDIRAVVKTVFHHLNHASMYGMNRFDLTSSLGNDSQMHSSRGPDNRLLHLRTSRASPGANHNHLGITMEQRSSSLPRHFVRGGGVRVTNTANMHNSDAARVLYESGRGTHSPSPRMTHQSVSEAPQFSSTPTPGYSGDYTEEGGDPFVDEELSDSVRPTRCTSAQSLGSELPVNTSGWESVVDTADNSNRMSPVSPSDLPDSPTQCAQMHMPEPLQSISIPLNVHTETSRGRSGLNPMKCGSDTSRLTSSDATTAAMSEEPTPTFAPLNPRRTQQQRFIDDAVPGRDNSIDEDDYAVLEEQAGALLDASITAAFPPLRNLPKSTELDTDRLLADMIENAMPSPSTARRQDDRGYSSASTVPMEQRGTGGGHHHRHHAPQPSSSCVVAEDRFLMDAIMSAMPSSSPANSPFHPKNVSGGRAATAQRQRGVNHAQSAAFQPLPRPQLAPQQTQQHNTVYNNSGNNSDLFHAMANSSLVPDSSIHGERIKDASRLRNFSANPSTSWQFDEEEEEVSSSEGDSFPREDGPVHADLPEDVIEDAENEAEAVVIDCAPFGKRNKPAPPSRNGIVTQKSVAPSVGRVTGTARPSAIPTSSALRRPPPPARGSSLSTSNTRPSVASKVSASIAAPSRRPASGHVVASSSAGATPSPVMNGNGKAKTAINKPTRTAVLGHDKSSVPIAPRPGSGLRQPVASSSDFSTAATRRRSQSPFLGNTENKNCDGDEVPVMEPETATSQQPNSQPVAESKRLPPPFPKPNIATKPAGVAGEKVTKTAVVSPCNYQKPKEPHLDEELAREDEKPKENVDVNNEDGKGSGDQKMTRKNTSEEIRPNTKQMLVTTV